MILFGTLYHIKFISKSDEYKNYLPTCRKMIDSFEKEIGEEDWKELKGHYLVTDGLRN